MFFIYATFSLIVIFAAMVVGYALMAIVDNAQRELDELNEVPEEPKKP